MGHIKQIGSAMHDAWNMLSSKIKSECDMLKEDSQTNFLMQIISHRILCVCVCVCRFQSAYHSMKFLKMRNSVFLHTLSQEIYDARLLDFRQHDMWTISGPKDTRSFSARYLSKSFWQTKMNFSQQANPRRSFSSTELRLLQHNNQTKPRV